MARGDRYLLSPGGYSQSAPLIYVTIPFVREGYREVVKDHRVGMRAMDTLIATLCITTGQYFGWSLACSFLHLGKKVLKKTEDHSQKKLVDVFGQHRSVWIEKEGIEVEIPFDALKTGDIVVVNAGETIPVDGVIVRGMASVDQHILTGESQPADRESGDKVFALTLVLMGRIYVKVEKTGEETTAASIALILNRTANFKQEVQLRGEAVGNRLVLPNLAFGGIALFTRGIESALPALNARFALYMRVLAPIGMLNFLNIASHHGILIKDGRVLDRMLQVDTIIFDKTGTLTEDTPHIGKIHPMEGYDENEILKYVASAEHKQTHPIAKAILKEAGERGLAVLATDDVEYKIGYGIAVTIDNRVIRVGSARFMEALGITLPPEMRELDKEARHQGHTSVMVAFDDRAVGLVELHATVRPEAKSIIRELRRYATSMYIISGDHEMPTRKLAQDLGIDHYFAETLPENKAALISQLQNQGKIVCYVGDGINDSIALKKANVSVSLRGASTVATDTAQVILMDESLRQLARVFDLARNFDSTMKSTLATTIVPGIISVTGAFFLNFRLIHSILLNQASLVVGLGITAWPLLQEKRKSERIEYRKASEELN
ncbi:heavy metal translocating P-type ATPase [Desulfobacterales bacterium HSG2]|nr:heavy metal translocating P-type ATPase [Desulfobacterales bacterium HSG2]